MDCVFCGIVAGEEPARIVDETAEKLAFAPLDPLAPGHLLVVPQAHHESLFAVPDDVLADVTAHARDLALPPPRGRVRRRDPPERQHVLPVRPTPAPAPAPAPVRRRSIRRRPRPVPREGLRRRPRGRGRRRHHGTRGRRRPRFDGERRGRALSDRLSDVLA